MKLTEEQWHEIRSANQPVRVTDPQFKQEYVVVPAGTFDCLMELHYEDGEPIKEESIITFMSPAKWQAGFNPKWMCTTITMRN